MDLVVRQHRFAICTSGELLAREVTCDLARCQIRYNLISSLHSDCNLLNSSMSRCDFPIYKGRFSPFWWLRMTFRNNSISGLAYLPGVPESYAAVRRGCLVSASKVTLPLKYNLQMKTRAFFMDVYSSISLFRSVSFRWCRYDTHSIFKFHEFVLTYIYLFFCHCMPKSLEIFDINEIFFVH